MIELLISNMPQFGGPSQELIMLAEPIRTGLARFSPSDPQIAALRSSKAYQKVAHRIVRTSIAAWGSPVQ